MFCTDFLGLRLVSTFALVGGQWNDTLKAGLWYWNVNETSSNAWTTIGARLLNLFWNLVCVSVVLVADLLVGGRWLDGSECGFWCWTVNDASSMANTNYGARLIIWDLMCVRPVLCCSSLLSAVIGTILLELACGIGTWIGLGLIMALMSVLDRLYGN